MRFELFNDFTGTIRAYVDMYVDHRPITEPEHIFVLRLDDDFVFIKGHLRLLDNFLLRFFRVADWVCRN